MLTLLFLAQNGDSWTVEDVPAAKWAVLLGLDEPETLGAARVTKAIGWLEQSAIIDADRQRGRPPRLRGRHESGKGPYTSPTGRVGVRQPEEDRYSQLHRDFWLNGWVSVLSARAIAALVILLDATWAKSGSATQGKKLKSGEDYREVVSLPWWHLTEQNLVDRYALSRDLFDRGVNELIEWDLVEKRKKPTIARTDWDERRWYRELRVRLEVVRTSVADVAAGVEVKRVPPAGEFAERLSRGGDGPAF